jgi:ABC-2 type transport system permease protein
MTELAKRTDQAQPAATGLAIAWTLARRELIHFVRQPARIVAAIGTPLLMWVFLAGGFGESLRPGTFDSPTYASYLLPGMMTLVATFAAIFASISIIEDRRGGWLQSVLVSPAPRWAIALGRIAGGAMVAFAQSALLMLALPFVHAAVTVSGVLAALLALAFTCIAMTALGLMFAWRSETTASFHAVMNIVFMPMWLLSGAFFPAGSASPWIRWPMLINPLTWCTEAIRAPLTGETAVGWGWLVAAGAFALAMFAAATAVISAPSRH